MAWNPFSRKGADADQPTGDGPNADPDVRALLAHGGWRLEDPRPTAAEHPDTFGAGFTLVRREYPTAIGPVDLMCRDSSGASVAVEIKRRGEIDGVEQLTRYLELLNRDSLLAPVSGVFAAQQIKPQAKTLATDRGIRCLTLDYDKMRGMDNDEFRLF